MRHSFCHFADDLRFELGNKVSLIGMYSGEMFVSTLPALVPKLVATAFCATPVNDPIKSLSFKVLLGDQLLQEGVLPADALQHMQAQLANRGSEEDPVSEVSVGINVILTPLNVTAPSTLKVLLMVDGREMVAGKLRIQQGGDHPLPQPT